MTRAKVTGNLDEVATRLLKCRLSIIPLLANKRPAIKSWKPYQTKSPKIGELKYNSSGLGLVCGKVSGNVEVIDIDVKFYKGKGNLYELLKEAIERAIPGLFKKFVIQKTISGGYHLIYRSNVIEGNHHLAQNKNGNPIIETRGQGGYIAIEPTPGYSLEQGAFERIRNLTPTERVKLIEACRSFDESAPSGSKTNSNRQHSSKRKSLGELDRHIDALGKKDITGNYKDWVNVMFGIAHTFGEAGRESMHKLCSNYPRYLREECDRKFDDCIKRKPKKPITIATVYQLIKKALPKRKLKHLLKEDNEAK